MNNKINGYLDLDVTFFKLLFYERSKNDVESVLITKRPLYLLFWKTSNP